MTSKTTGSQFQPDISGINTNIILGVDPGLAFTGFACLKGGQVVDYSVCSTSPQDGLPKRLHQIKQAMNQQIIKHKPTAIALEEFIMIKKSSNGFNTAKAIGVICAEAGGYRVPIIFYLPAAKKRVVGSYEKTSADKAHAVLNYVETELGFHIRKTDIHAADAIVMALCAYRNLDPLVIYLP